MWQLMQRFGTAYTAEVVKGLYAGIGAPLHHAGGTADAVPFASSQAFTAAIPGAQLWVPLRIASTAPREGPPVLKVIVRYAQGAPEELVLRDGVECPSLSPDGKRIATTSIQSRPTTRWS